MNFSNLKRKGWEFCVLVALLSIAPYYLFLTDTNEESSWTLLIMWIPTFAAVSLRLYYKNDLFSDLKWNPLIDFIWTLFWLVTASIIYKTNKKLIFKNHAIN